MSTTPNLNACSTCGGPLRLVDGTDPDEAADTGVWEETYECDVCGGTGTYHVDRSGPDMRTRGTGVVA